MMSNVRLKVLICDDREERRAEWLEQLQAVEALGDRLLPLEFDRDRFDTDFKALKRRRTEARPHSASEADPAPLTLAELSEITDPVDDSNIFDQADVLIVDYALERFEGEDGYLTGALVAYLARCYSSCGVIVGVNQHGENPFDLTLLGDRTSFADVDIGQDQLANRGLWSNEWGGFRPWSWPVVPDLVARHYQRVAIVEGALTSSVLEVLELLQSVPTMPRSALQDLERRGATVEDITFETVARSPVLGLRRGEHPMSLCALSRIGAARVAKWLETAVLPLQDVLIDAPHLAARNAKLLAGSPAEITAWNATCQVGATNGAGLVQELNEYRYETAWTTRATWRWGELTRDERLPGIADPWDIPSTEWVFCEDLSAFQRRIHARRLVMEVGSLTTRWVSNPELIDDAELLKVDYQPQRRLSL
jgi:hypothetical protein